MTFLGITFVASYSIARRAERGRVTRYRSISDTLSASRMRLARPELQKNIKSYVKSKKPRPHLRMYFQGPPLHPSAGYAKLE